MLKKLKKYVASPRFVGKCLNFLSYILPSKAGAIAYRLFCTPQKGRTFNKKEERFLNSAQQSSLSVRDFEIQTYVWEGGAEKVLLAHGWDSNVARWRGLVPILQKAGLTIIALDAPAHGKSGSKIANGILYAEAIQEAVIAHKPDYVIGHSFGGMSAAFYFSDYEALEIKKLILLGTPSKLSTIMANFNEVLGLGAKAQKATGNYFKKAIGFDIDYFAVESYIKKVELPGLVMHDEQDQIAPYSEAMAVHENWKGSSLFATQGLGHSMQAGSVFRRIVEELTNG